MVWAQVKKSSLLFACYWETLHENFEVRLFLNVKDTVIDVEKSIFFVINFIKQIISYLQNWVLEVNMTITYDLVFFKNLSNILVKELNRLYDFIWILINEMKRWFFPSSIGWVFILGAYEDYDEIVFFIPEPIANRLILIEEAETLFEHGNRFNVVYPVL